LSPSNRSDRCPGGRTRRPGIGETTCNTVQVDANPIAIDDGRRERFLDDQMEFGMAVALGVGAEVADVLSCAERRSGLLNRKTV
jgi:hypothetical protein